MLLALNVMVASVLQDTDKLTSYFYDRVGYSSHRSDVRIVSFVVMSPFVNETQTSWLMEGSEFLQARSISVQSATIEVTESFPRGLSGKMKMVVDYSLTGANLPAPQVGQRLFGAVGVTNDQGIATPPGGFALTPSTSFWGIKSDAPVVVPGSCFELKSLTLTTGQGVDETLFKTCFADMAGLTAKELAERLGSFDGGYVHLDSKNPNFNALLTNRHRDESHEYLLAQMQTLSPLKRFIVASNLVRWRVLGSPKVFMEALDGVSDEANFGQYVDLKKLELRFTKLDETPQWKITTPELLDRIEAVESLDLKFALIRAIGPAGQHLPRVAKLLLISDLDIQTAVINRLGSELKMPEKKVDSRSKGEERSEQIEQLVRFWMEYFHVIDPV